MKQLLFSMLAVLCVMTAAAQSQGNSNLCDKAIYVDSTLVLPIEVNELYLFTGNTEDLPISVYFIPDEVPTNEPFIYVDLTCEMGVYKDDNIKELIEFAAGLDVYFPLAMPLDKMEQDGKTIYYVSYDRGLVDLLAALGIDYSIPVYVLFESEVTGTIQVNNIKTITSCTDLSVRGVNLQDTIHLQANTEALYYFPVSEWKGENMSFTWTGSTALTAYLEKDCAFEDRNASRYIYDFAGTNTVGQYVQNVPAIDIQNYISYSEDGNLYVLFTPTEDGDVYVKNYVDHGAVTINTCTKNAKSTAIDFPIVDAGLAMEASIPSKSYRIESDKLKNKDVRLTWKASENKTAVAYFANFCGFELKASDPDVIDTVHFVFNEEEQAMIADIPRERVNNIVKQNTEGWLFMQIYRQEAGTFSWDEYEVVYPDCDGKSILLQPNDSVEMPADYYNTSYKLVAKDWIGYRHTFTWKSTRQAYIFIADSCSFPLAPYNVHVGKYMVVNPNDSVSMSVDDIEMLNKDFTDEYGNLYLRLRSTAPGELVVRQYTNTGLFDNVIINGRDVKLVIINQSLYIQISDATSVEYYDLMGRKVELED